MSERERERERAKEKASFFLISSFSLVMKYAYGSVCFFNSIQNSVLTLFLSNRLILLPLLQFPCYMQILPEDSQVFSA